MRAGIWGAVIACALVLATAAVATASEGITIETSAGPVTCAPDPEHEPGPEAISATPFARGAKIEISETGALRCQTSTFGEVEVTGAGLPWQLTLNEKRLTARLRGSGKPGLLVRSVAIPALACFYEARNVLGTLTSGSSPSVSLSVTHIRLKRASSSALCPALGPLDLALALP